MHAAKVSVDERVPRLRLVGRADGQPEVPRRVLVPAVRLQECVLLGGAWLHLVPLAPQDVLARLDQLARADDATLVDRVGGHAATTARVVSRPSAPAPRRTRVGQSPRTGIRASGSVYRTRGPLSARSRPERAPACTCRADRSAPARIADSSRGARCP